jgi:hypothetical protein
VPIGSEGTVDGEAPRIGAKDLADPPTHASRMQRLPGILGRRCEITTSAASRLAR